jgi:hypothetical protein
MVDVVPDEGKQVPETALYFPDLTRKLGQPRCKFRKPLLLNRLVVHDDAAPSLQEHRTEK